MKKTRLIIAIALGAIILITGAIVAILKFTKPNEQPASGEDVTTQTLPDDNLSVDDYISTLFPNNVYAEVGHANGVAYDLVKWQIIDSVYYLFLPTGVDNTSLTLWETYEEELFIDDISIVNGEKYNLAVGKHTIKFGDTTATLEVMMSANVPSMFIKTDNKNGLAMLLGSKENSLSGEIAFVGIDGSVTATAMERINGRGNTSWNAGRLFGKYPFNIKLTEKTDVFGMGNNKKWCIIPQVFDESLIRNVLSNDLARAAGLENTPNAENVDVYFNGEYIGTYLLSQRVDLGKNKLISSEEGFLVECELMERYDAEENKFITERNQAIIVKAPDTVEPADLVTIQDYMQRVEDAIYSPDGYNSNGEHYSDLIDVDSFVKVYLINEFSMNLDGGATSFYMYKAGDDKLKAGPVWDFDWAYGSYAYRDGVDLARGKNWYIRYKKQYDGNDLAIMAKLCAHPKFWSKVKEEWNNSFGGYVKSQLEGGSLTSIDEYMEKYQATAAMNFTRYDILSTHEWGSTNTGSTYEANIAFLKGYYRNRIEFLDEKM